MVTAVGGATVAAVASFGAATALAKYSLSEGKNDKGEKYSGEKYSEPAQSNGLRGEWVLVFRISNDKWAESTWKARTGPEQIERIDDILAEALPEHGGFPRERLDLKIYETWLEFRIAIFNGLLDLLVTRCDLKCHIFRSASEGLFGDHFNLMVLVRMPESTAREEAFRQAYELPLHPSVSKQMNLTDSLGYPPGYAKFNERSLAHYMDKHQKPMFHKRFGKLTMGKRVITGNVFGMLDRMRLMSHAIAQHVDIHNLIHKDIITAHFPLHNSEELAALVDNWTQVEVQAYFGNGVAFYFAFAEHLLQSLLPLALIGAISEILQATIKIALAKLVILEVSGCMVVLWGFLYLRTWARRESFLKTQWSPASHEQSGRARARLNPRYAGYWSKDPVTGIDRKKQRRRTKLLRRVVGKVITLVFISVVVVSILLIFRFQTFLMRQEFEHATTIISVLNAVQMKVFELIWSNVAWFLVDFENYKTLDKRRDALIWKLFGFRAVNSFGAALWIAFGKPRDLCKYDNCVLELKVFLATVFATYTGLTVWSNIALPWVRYRIQMVLEENHYGNSDDGGPQRPQSFVERQLSMHDYDDMAQIEDYITVVIQFGLVSLFFTVLPSISVLAVISIFMQIRSSAWKLSYTYRRPFPEETASVGAWNGVIYLLVRAGVLVNAGLVIFTSDLFEDYSDMEKCFFLFAAEVASGVVQWTIEHYVSGISKRAKITKKRHAVLLERLHNDQVGCKECADDKHAKLEVDPEPEYFSPSDYRCGKVPQYDINEAHPRFLSDQLLAPHLQTIPQMEALGLCEKLRCGSRAPRKGQKKNSLDMTKATSVVPELSPMEDSKANSSDPNRARDKRRVASMAVHPTREAELPRLH